MTGSIPHGKSSPPEAVVLRHVCQHVGQAFASHRFQLAVIMVSMAWVGYTCVFTLIHFAELPRQGMFIQLVTEVPVPATEVETECKQPGGLVSSGCGSSSCGVERAAYMALHTQQQQIFYRYFKLADTL